MKRTGLVLLSIWLICLGTSCVTPGRAALLSQNDTIALVAVAANWDINWKDEEPINPGLVGAHARRALQADPDLTVISNSEELINTAEMLFRETMADSGLINLADKETFLLSRAYQDARLNRHQVNNEYVSADGYRLVDFRDKNFSQALAAETGIQRSMFVEFNFTKTMRSGFGKNGDGGADVDMRVVVLDSGGRVLYRKVFSVRSISSIRVSGGRYSRSGLIQLFESAIADAAYEFLYHLEDW